MFTAQKSREHSARLDALTDREWRRNCGDLQCCMQHGIGSITSVHGRAGAQYELDAVKRDVGVQHRDAEGITCFGDAVNEMPELLGDSSGAHRRQLCSHSRHQHKAHRYQAMLAAEAGKRR